MITKICFIFKKKIYQNLTYFVRCVTSHYICRSHNLIRIDLQHVIDYKDYSLNLFFSRVFDEIVRSLGFNENK
jgi:hypothetical protein